MPTGQTIKYDLAAKPRWEPPAPTPDQEKFHAVFMYLADKFKDDAAVGRTSLHKLLYYIDLDHYELYGTPMMGMEYTKYRYGPYIKGLDKLLAPLIQTGALTKHKLGKKAPGKAEYKYIPTRTDATSLGADDRDHIESVISRLAPNGPHELTAMRLERRAQKDVPYLGTAFNKPIRYSLVYQRADDARLLPVEDA